MEWLTEDMVLDGIEAILNPKAPEKVDRGAMFAKLLGRAKANRVTGATPELPTGEETIG